MKKIDFTTVITVFIFTLIFVIVNTNSSNATKPYDPGSDTIKKVMEQIRPEAIRAHTAFLSDDQFEGRKTGTKGYMLAAKYIRSQCEAFGLSGGSDDKTYFQKVPFVRTIVLPNESFLKFTKEGKTRSLEFLREYAILDAHSEMKASTSGDLIFVGFGVTAPELGYDDYRGLDVKGKIVVIIMFESPPSFPSAFRAYYSNYNVKRANAASHDAAGIIFIRTPRWTWSGLLRAISNGWNTVRCGNEDTENVNKENNLSVAVINESAAFDLFEMERHSLAEIFADAQKGTLKGFRLSTQAEMNFISREEKFECVNVLASLEGSDPIQKKEYVVYSAHLDHFGIGKPLDGDSIYNGAIDNAGGCAELIELMRAYSSLSKPPKRSILFLFTTAEECGNLGSDYFVHHPTFPLKQIIADLNVDEPMSLVPVNDVIGFGSEHSSLGATIQQTAGQSGFTVSPDPYPEEGLFTRSDVFPLIEQGIPSVWITVGTNSIQQGIDGLAVQKNWMATNYHSPKDDITQLIDFETAAKFNRFLFLLGYNIANNKERPAWNEGDFFSNK